jgi:O-antigen/teichoic acid export membrane protein
MLVLVLSVSWTVPYLGEERFGAWMTIASLATVLSFLDLGVGNGLTNRIAHAASASDPSELSRAISGGLGVLVALSLALLVLLMVAAWVLPWPMLIKTTLNALDEEVRTAALLFAGLFAVSTCTNGVLRIYHGMQRGFEVFATSAACTLVGLLLLYTATLYRANMPMLLICSMAGSILPGIWLWLRLGRTGLFRLAGWVDATKREKPRLFGVSLLFFVLQIGTALGWGMDSLIISSTLGASAVTSYTLVQRMYLIATQPMLILNGPLWPAYADADARNDRAFIRKTLVSAASVTLVYTASSVLLLAWGSAPLLRRWTGGAVAPPAEIVYALGVWTIVAAMANCFAMFLNGMGILKPQVIAVLVIIAIGVPLKFLVARALGIDAMIYIFSAFFVVTLVTLYGVLYRVPIEDHLGIGSLRADTK